MKDLIISLGVNGRENYAAGLPRLYESARQHFKGAVRLLNRYTEDVTPHSEMPYKFKFDLIRQARQDGYKRIFWLDSTMRLTGNISDLLTNAECGIVAFENEGHELAHYISDAAVSNLISKEIIDGEYHLGFITQVWGGAVGWDFSNPIAETVFYKVIEQIEIGSFTDGGSSRNGFVAHRHDQAVLSCILDHYDIDLLPYGVIAAKADANPNTYIQYGD